MEEKDNCGCPECGTANAKEEQKTGAETAGKSQEQSCCCQPSAKKSRTKLEVYACIFRVFAWLSGIYAMLFIAANWALVLKTGTMEGSIQGGLASTLSYLVTGFIFVVFFLGMEELFRTASRIESRISQD